MATDELDLAFRSVKSLAADMIAGRGSRSQVFSALFKLNDAIGRRARGHREAMQELIPLQQQVNGITVAVKTSDSNLLQASITSAEEIIKRLSKPRTEKPMK